MKNTKTIWGVVILVLVVVILIAVSKSSIIPGRYDALATCLSQKGVKFYGAFWCPHCQNQKQMFGGSAKLLPYVECSTADGQGMLPICKDNKIEGFPTWVFPDGSRLSGEVQPATLAEKSSCPLK